MNVADYAIIAILAVSVLIGLWRGLVTEVMALVVWIAAFWGAWWFGPTVSGWFAGSIQTPSVRIIAGYAVCFVAVLLIGVVLRFVLDRLVEGTGLSGSDRLLGMVFGLARGLLLVAVVVFVLGFTPFPRDAWWQQSRLLPTFVAGADWLGGKLPADMRQYLRPDVHDAPRTGFSNLLPAAPENMAVPVSDVARLPEAVRSPDRTDSPSFARPPLRATGGLPASAGSAPPAW